MHKLDIFHAAKVPRLAPAVQGCEQGAQNE